MNYAQTIIKGLNQSISHFHCVEYSSKLLEEAGFVQLNESENWKLKPSGKYFLTKNSSNLFAFTVGAKTQLDKTLFRVIGTHTDSPNLRLAPNSYKKSGHIERLFLQTYGGGQWQTWFDRDLSVCGKVVFKDQDNNIKNKIIRIDEPLFNIPHLAIHLTSDRNKPFNWNNEEHLRLVLSMGLAGCLEGEGSDSNEKSDKNEDKSKTVPDIEKKLGEKLSSLIAEKVGVKKDNLIDYELVLYDVQPSNIMGIDKEFVTSGRLDNLGSSLVAVDSIIESAKNISSQDSINVIAMFDHEEVGSLSVQGADSIHFANVIQRVFNTIESCGEAQKDSFAAACSRSFCLSADLAHATHPNYQEKHQSNHHVLLHKGVTIKLNPNQRYASDSEGGAILKEIGKKVGVPLQEFIVRQDSPCGTTIGPIISSNTGIKTIDIGIGCFAMHSIRETASSIDFYHYLNLMTGFFNDEKKDYRVFNVKG